MKGHSGERHGINGKVETTTNSATTDRKNYADYYNNNNNIKKGSRDKAIYKIDKRLTD